MTAPQPLDPAEVRRRANEWFARQLERAAKAHGAAWPEHREWVEDYLKQELRDRLAAIGWKATK